MPSGSRENDFYTRPVAEGERVPDDILQQIKTSQTKLKSLLRGYTETWNLPERIRQLKQLPDNPENKTQIALLEDLNKLNQLSALSIPGEGEREAKIYFVLPETAGGVTEKISLISEDQVRKQLKHLNSAQELTPENYLDNRKNYRLSMNAILKLPKHGKITEVQRESMALQVSRTLGLNTTDSSMVSYRGKPALFVPFEEIKLLSEYAKGVIFKAADFSRKEYQHYATINPVGGGLQGNEFVEDFGKSLSLFALCEDTDALGGYMQNKALSDDKSLYIFDQVIMANDKLELDSRLSLQPSEFIMKHTRHGQGRNRTLIEDSSMVLKFASLELLGRKRDELLQSAQKTIEQHNQKIAALDPRGDREQINDLILLRNDAVLIKDTIERRIEKIKNVYPQHDATITPEILRQTLILEKLMHNPVLFTDSGRPYRNPWTRRHNNPVESVISDPESGKLIITFANKLNPGQVAFMKRHKCSFDYPGDNQIAIWPHDLEALKETQLFPEQEPTISSSAKYLDPNDLLMMKTSYRDGKRDKIIALINEYQSQMNRTFKRDQKIELIRQTQDKLEDYMRTAKHPGFACHVLKKFHFDTQQKLQPKLIPNHSQVADAFEAAVKLDRIEEFNRMSMLAINNEIDKEQFGNFLTICIQAEKEATNYESAKRASSKIKDATEPRPPRPEAIIKSGWKQRLEELRSTFNRTFSSEQISEEEQDQQQQVDPRHGS